MSPTSVHGEEIQNTICSVLCRRRARAKGSVEAGDERITRHASDLAAQGFKCIPLGVSTFPVPEIIAVKDDRVVAIRVVAKTPTEAQVDRYESLPFDDVQWVVEGRPRRGKRREVVSLGRRPMMRELVCDRGQKSRTLRSFPSLHSPSLASSREPAGSPLFFKSLPHNRRQAADGSPAVRRQCAVIPGLCSPLTPTIFLRCTETKKGGHSLPAFFCQDYFISETQECQPPVLVQYISDTSPPFFDFPPIAPGTGEG